MRSSVVAAASFLAVANAQLHRSFWGMAYSPDGVILPNCGASQAQVTQDIIKLAQLTPRIRLYGSDCNQTALVLQGIRDAGNPDLSVWAGIYIDGNDTVYQRQMDTFVDAVRTYGTEHIAGLTVGNEFLLLSYGDGGSPTNAAGVAARTKLLGYIQQANQTIQALNLDKKIPIGTADAGSAVTEELCAGVEYYMANVHPWFGNVPVQQAAGWTYDFFQNNDVAVCNRAPNRPQNYIAETGWPTASDNGTALSGGTPASVGNLQQFLDSYVCQANTNGTGYFYFEFKDETWKRIYGGVEPHWGLYNADRTLKAITIPNCPVDSPTGRQVNDTQAVRDAINNNGGSTGSTGSGSGGSGSGTSGGNNGAAARFGISASAAVAAVGVAAVAFGVLA